LENETVYKITVEGQIIPLVFDVNSNPTKKGIKLQFALPEGSQYLQNPRLKQQLANKISTVLQKRLGEAEIMIDYDTQTPYRNVIGFIVPLVSVANIILKAIKGE
jgi:biopolymer transport protein ExbD